MIREYGGIVGPDGTPATAPWPWRQDPEPDAPTEVSLFADGLVHPEDFCHRCHGPNISWHAPSPLWNKVMRGGSIDGPEKFSGIVCPLCFAVLAQEQGVARGWRLTARQVLVELETATPSGRVWNEARDMWEDPAERVAIPDLTDEERAAWIAAFEEASKGPAIVLPQSGVNVPEAQYAAMLAVVEAARTYALTYAAYNIFGDDGHPQRRRANADARQALLAAVDALPAPEES
jgi:hypothetical protein